MHLQEMFGLVELFYFIWYKVTFLFQAILRIKLLIKSLALQFNFHNKVKLHKIAES